jgi:Holliday junction resolvase-like predicted endonuclease
MKIYFYKIFQEDNLSYKKIQRLERIATEYLQSHYMQHKNYYFDAISVLFDENGKALVRHFEHIF